MCRKLRPFWFPVPSLSNRKLAERVLLDSIQKGPPDIPAWVHAPIETFLVSRLCKTPITPNQLTLFCNVVAWTVTILLVTGHLAWGLGLALIVGVLDGLDGKLARLKLETSKAGKLEHLFDALFENSWWLALAWHLSVSGKLPDAFSYLGLLIGAEVTERTGARKHRSLLRKIDQRAGAFRSYLPSRGRTAEYLRLDSRARAYLVALPPEPSNSSPGGKPSRLPFSWHAWPGHCGLSGVRVPPARFDTSSPSPRRSLPAGLGTSLVT